MAKWHLRPSRYVDLASKVFCSIHLRAISKEVLINLNHNMRPEITLLKFIISTLKGRWVNNQQLFDVEGSYKVHIYLQQHKFSETTYLSVDAIDVQFHHVLSTRVILGLSLSILGVDDAEKK